MQYHLSLYIPLAHTKKNGKSSNLVILPKFSEFLQILKELKVVWSLKELDVEPSSESFSSSSLLTAFLPQGHCEINYNYEEDLPSYLIS